MVGPNAGKHLTSTLEGCREQPVSHLGRRLLHKLEHAVEVSPKLLVLVPECTDGSAQSDPHLPRDIRDLLKAGLHVITSDLSKRHYRKS